MVLGMGDDLSSKGRIRVTHCGRLQILQLLLLLYMFFGCSPWGMNYHSILFKVAGTVLKHANYSLLAVTTVMQYAHTYVSVAVRLPALRVINVRVHVRFHREGILPELAHP